MQRRQFLTSSLAAGAGVLTGRTGAAPESARDSAAGKVRQYYELRKYLLRQGAETQLTDNYVATALIPALNRMGIAPVGAFNLSIGPETPALYLLLPCAHLETLVNAELRLREDQEFLAAADAFWNAPAAAPAFQRVESTLLIAFEGWPVLTLPPPTATKGKRVFQLRTYESASERDHVRKVKMFHAGEFGIFEKVGFWNVFFGDALIGSRLPQLTYMLSFADLKEMDDLWAAFRDDPDWKKLNTVQEFNFEPIVSNISNLVLMPAGYSQI
ncbi:MAG: NIPSNAP family protein [Acidobacteriaceae bacterium]